MSASPQMRLPRLLLVLDVARVVDWTKILDGLERSCVAGLPWVQLRDKQSGDSEMAETMRELDRRLPGKTLRSVNGRPQLAREFGWGLHLPASASYPESGSFRCLGRSIHGPSEAERSGTEALDYLIAGTLFPTDSKPGIPGTGLEGLVSILDSSLGRPVLGIGGVDAGSAARIRGAGAWGVAVFGAILGAPNPADATRELLRALRD